MIGFFNPDPFGFGKVFKNIYGNKENENAKGSQMSNHYKNNNKNPNVPISTKKTFVSGGITTNNTKVNDYTKKINQQVKNQPIAPFPKIIDNNNVVEVKDLSITVPDKANKRVILDKTSNIGNSHIINQDYASVGSFKYLDKDFSFAIVSDGCSSSENSEIGSMVLTNVTKKLLKSGLLSYDLLKTNIPEHARLVLENLGISDFSVLDATLIILLINETDNRFTVYFYGDGFLKIQYLDQTVIKGLEYSKNSPNYISYNLTPDRLSTYNNYEQSLTVSTYNININNEYTSSKEVKKSTDQVMFQYSLEGVKTISIMTDGVESLKDVNTSESEDTVNVIESITDFKNFNGNFLVRRYNAFKRTVLKTSIVHQDDLTIATAYINNEA